MKIKEHLATLGLPAKDKVTGFRGVITTISFDLYGCVQAVVTPKAGNGGRGFDGRWFDLARLVLLSKNPVMDVPNFDFGPQADGKQGSAEKPIFSKV